VSDSGFVDVVFNTPARGLFTYSTAGLSGCVPGVRVKAPFGRRALTGFVVASREQPPEGDYTLKPIERVVDAEPLFDEDYVRLASWLAGMYLCSIGEALATMLPGGRRESKLPAVADGEELLAHRHELAPQQRSALEGVLAAPSGISYLFGVTGSGKTEVYLQVAESVIAEGRSVIYLVPEISLTHQLVEAVWERFKNDVAVLHSALTPSQKLVEWMKIRRGEAQFVIGARSAIFAPVKNLGLVIIDEEHEGSYKSGSTPRYHARQVAMRRCSVDEARLVMGSATPSVEAYHLMSTGRIRALRLPDRLSGGGMPAVEVVDMKRESSGISAALAAQIRSTAEEGRQSILFLNRRGFSYFFHCRTCGYEMRCERCSVSLTYHKERNRMICHYCGSSRQPVEVCPECGSLDVGYSGFGTEMVEEDVRRRFPDLRVVRVDTDAIRKRGQLRDTLNQFRAGEIDILLGTQMVAKGLNFPGVKLVGIVLADTGLHLPDFRAQERTFALIVQVAGRAGRYLPDGKVVIQTYRPDADAVRLAASHDLSTFYEKELATREALGFPPFSRLIRLVFRGRERERVQSTAASYAEAIAAGLKQGEVLGPAECPLSIISGNHRYQLIARSRSFAHLHDAVSRVANGRHPDHGVYVELDVDPVSLL